MAKGLFITVEGIEGVGKSTNIDFMVSHIESAGFDVMRTREPGGTTTAERIRTLVLEHGDEPIPEVAELLLFFASRSLNIENSIRPALARGAWVVCDRFTDTSRAYQGAGRELGLERVNTLAEWVHGDCQPDMTLLLDAPPEVGMRRASERGQTDRMESEQLSFFERVRNQYLSLANDEPERFVVVDATQSLQAVQQQIAAALDQRINVLKNIK